MGKVQASGFSLGTRFLFGILLIVVVVVGVFVYVYYSMGQASVSTLVIDDVLADRNFVAGTYPNRIATYIFEILVWSKAQALSVTLGKPLFYADIDGVPLGNETLRSGTVSPGSCLSYNLRFSINESRAISTISGNANSLFLNMTAFAQSGLYSHTITTIGGHAWNWTTATLIPYSNELPLSPPC